MNMGVFSSMFSLTSLSSSTESLESMRKKHGFSDFDDEMNRLRDYDPAAELEKAEMQAVPKVNDGCNKNAK